MTDTENASEDEPAGSATASAEPTPARPASSQPQTVAVDDPTNLLPPVVVAPRPAPAADDAPDEDPSDHHAPDEDAPDEDAPDHDASPDGETPRAETAAAPPPALPRPEPRGGRVITVATLAVAVVVAGGATAFALTWTGGGGPPPAVGPPATACLVGTWRSTQIVFGDIATTGTETLEFRADGTGVDTLDRVTVTSDDGHTHMYDGTVMFRYVAATAIVNVTAPTGTLVDRDLTAETTKTATPAYEPRNIACSATSLTLSNGSDLSRFTRG